SLFFFTVFSRRSAAHLHRPSFPTRRSSDLAVRAAGGGGVPETHGDVVRLGLRLVRRAVGRLAEDLRGEFGGGRGDGDVGAALPAGDQQRPAVALGQGGGPVLLPDGPQQTGAGGEQGRGGAHAVDGDAVRVGLLAGGETVQEQCVDD